MENLSFMACQGQLGTVASGWATLGPCYPALGSYRGTRLGEEGEALHFHLLRFIRVVEGNNGTANFPSSSKLKRMGLEKVEPGHTTLPWLLSGQLWQEDMGEQSLGNMFVWNRRAVLGES